MNTFATDNQFGLSASKVEANIDVPQNSHLGHLLEVTGAAIVELERHSLTSQKANDTAIETELPVNATAIDPSSVDTIAAQHLVEQAFKAENEQFTLAA